MKKIKVGSDFSGVGFTIESIDPLQKLRPKQAPIFKQQKKLDIWDELNKKANQ